MAGLTTLVNALADADADNAEVGQAIQNLKEWSDSLRDQRELLIEAVERRSSFTFDMIHWIRHVTSALLAVSTNPACSVHTPR